MENVSIIFTHWAQNEERSALMLKSLQSLIASAPKAELLVYDNGESLKDSQQLLNWTHYGHISAYTRFRHNMHFAFARNDGLARATKDYIVISDNDILFKKGWLEECVAFLEKEGTEKCLATPLAPDLMHQGPKHDAGELHGWKLNYRAGSNCFVARRKDFETIGSFIIHRVAGSHWNDAASREGYTIAVMPEPKAEDVGFRRGYNTKQALPHTAL